jgi:hypothetical protein
MWIRFSAALVLLAMTLPLRAQTPPPAETPASPEDLGRAQRQADSPMQRILMAAKIPRKGGTDGPAAADPSPTNEVAAITPRSAPAPAPLRVITAAELGKLPTKVPGSMTPVALQSLPDWAALPTPQPEMAAMLVEPKLLSIVQPELPDRLLEKLRSHPQVLVALSLQADGQVSKVQVLPPSPSGLDRYLSDALMQWRYAPLPGPRVVRVELNFADR